jgi:hypothetical protein
MEEVKVPVLLKWKNEEAQKANELNGATDGRTIVVNKSEPNQKEKEDHSLTIVQVAVVVAMVVEISRRQ